MLVVSGLLVMSAPRLSKEFGDLSKEADARVKAGIQDFFGIGCHGNTV